MKYLPFTTALILSLVLISCELDDDDNTCIGCQTLYLDSIIIDSQGYNEAYVVGATIDSLSLSGDSLTVFYSSGGCDGSTWEAQLFDSGVIMESAPPQRNIVFSLENEELCFAYISKFSTFDLTPIQVPGDSAVSLNFFNTGETILYEY